MLLNALDAVLGIPQRDVLNTDNVTSAKQLGIESTNVQTVDSKSTPPYFLGCSYGRDDTIL